RAGGSPRGGSRRLGAQRGGPGAAGVGPGGEVGAESTARGAPGVTPRPGPEPLPPPPRHIRHQSPTWTNSSTGPCPPVSVKTRRRSFTRSESRGNGQTDSGKHSGRTVVLSGIGEVPGLEDVMGVMSGMDVRPHGTVTET